jgi:mRNA interferase ChpB
MDRGDIYFVALDPTAGHEQRGHRPVLVLTTAAFNKLTNAPVVLPITTGGAFARNIGFTVPLSGTRIAGLVRCDQPRALDLTARKARRVERVPAEIIEEALAKVSTLFE